jgi:hypothetical protein
MRRSHGSVVDGGLGGGGLGGEGKGYRGQEERREIGFHIVYQFSLIGDWLFTGVVKNEQRQVL